MTPRLSDADGDGFTLVEVLVALGLTTVLVAGAAHLFLMAIVATRDTRDETLATILALQKIEELRSVGAAVQPAPGGALSASLPGYSDTPDATSHDTPWDVAPPGGTYVRRWTSEPANGAAELTTLGVLVRPQRWSDPRSSSQPSRPAGVLVVTLSSP